MKERWSLVIHGVLLLSALCIYLEEADDVVWRFVRGTSNVRGWEHICFAIAAATLAVSLALRVQTDGQLMDSTREREEAGPRMIASDFLQALGIGSLMPLAGFILLVVGETAFSVLRYASTKQVSSGLTSRNGATLHSGQDIEVASRSTRPKRVEPGELLSRHAGLFCAFASMVAFSITLSDRLADYLFAGSALVAILAHFLTRKESSS